MESAALIKERAAAAEIRSAFRLVWPDEARTLLLRACLHDRARAAKAWNAFTDRIGHPKPYFEQDRTGLKGLLPTIHFAAQRNKFVLEDSVRTYLRMAYVREELRSNIFRDLCKSLLQSLETLGIPSIVLKGCAFAETIYDTPAHRHQHAIELLVPATALPSFHQILQPHGFQPARLAEAPAGARRTFRHHSGLPLVAHAALFDPPAYPNDPQVLWSSSEPARMSGISTRVLSPAHNLIHVLVSAFHDQRRGNLRWACDAWRIMDGKSHLDWTQFVRFALHSRLELPTATMIEYMASTLDAAVPTEVISHLDCAARRSDRLAIETGLSGAIAGFSTLRQIWIDGARSPKARKMLIRFLILPSTGYLRWRFGSVPALCVPILYVYRPLSYMARWLWWHALTLPGLKGFTQYQKIAARIVASRS